MLTPSDLVEVRKILIATHLVTSGQFDKELAKIDEATRRLDEKHKSIMALADAEKVLRDADRAAYESGVKVKEQEAAFAKRVAAHETSIEQHKKDAAALAKLQEAERLASASHTRLRKSEQEQLAKEIAALKIEQARVAAAGDSINERTLALTKREAELNDKIAQMKALAV